MPNKISVRPETVSEDGTKETPTEKGGKFCSHFVADLLSIDMEKEEDNYDDEREDAAGFTKDFLQRTSLHGLQ